MGGGKREPQCISAASCARVTIPPDHNKVSSDSKTKVWTDMRVFGCSYDEGLNGAGG